jgi:hypothetical protein
MYCLESMTMLSLKVKMKTEDYILSLLSILLILQEGEIYMMNEIGVMSASILLAQLKKDWFTKGETEKDIGEMALEGFCNMLMENGMTFAQLQVILEQNGFEFTYNETEVDEVTMKRIKKWRSLG